MFFCFERMVDTSRGAWAKISLTLIDRVPERERRGER